MTCIDELLNAPHGGSAKDQKVSWNHGSWGASLSTGTGFDLATVTDTLAKIEQHRAAESGISRQAVVAIADGDPLRLLVAAMAWGFGPVGYGPYRTRKMLTTPGMGLEETLAEIFEASGRGASDAWPSLFTNGRPRISHLGVAMGSKYLYFAAGGPGGGAGAPVVYDMRLYNALTSLSGGLATAPNPRGYVTTAAYASVVAWIDAKAEEHSLHRDDVEYRLFGAAT